MAENTITCNLRRVLEHSFANGLLHNHMQLQNAGRLCGASWQLCPSDRYNVSDAYGPGHEGSACGFQMMESPGYVCNTSANDRVYLDVFDVVSVVSVALKVAAGSNWTVPVIASSECALWFCVQAYGSLSAEETGSLKSENFSAFTQNADSG